MIRTHTHTHTHTHTIGAPLLEASGLCIDTLGGRPLVDRLTVSLGRERVALVGRNGVGKSTLLQTLAGQRPPTRGTITLRTRARLIAQDPSRDEPLSALRRLLRRARASPGFARALGREAAAAGLALPEELAAREHSSALSRGEMRKIHLVDALLEEPDLLLLDEPTEDLDSRGRGWLIRWLSRWPGAAIVVSHDRQLLGLFRDFFILAESGCRALTGSFGQITETLEEEDEERQRQYAKNLNHLAAEEDRNITICRRRRRKKNVGRLHELRRRTSRARLNQKASDAQESQGRAAKIREQRISEIRRWALATRRALSVKLPLELLMPTLPASDDDELATLEGVGVELGPRSLFAGVDLRLGRARIAITGPNGAGKSTLLRVVLGERPPTSGVARRQRLRIGAIAQGATDWMTQESLLCRLQTSCSEASPEGLAQLLVGHKFPLALAERSLRSLSPGERVRAALICLLQRRPAPELLILDEPTFSLDLVGTAALIRALRAWPGGLLIASHDHSFLAELGVDAQLDLDGRGGHTWVENVV